MADAESRKPSAKDVADFKDAERLSRMQSKAKALETRIEQQWQAMAMKACDPLVKAYWVCRQEQGLMVVFKCRQEINAMRECVGSKTRDTETYAAFREERMAVIKDVMGSGDYIRPSHKEFKIPGKRD